MAKVGIIAGNGRFPIILTKEITKKGDTPVIAALKEEADPQLETLSQSFKWLPLGKLQQIINYFKEENVTNVVMAGQVKHRQIFAGLSLDLRAIKLLAGLVNKKADSILSAVANELQKDGITLLPSHTYLQHLLATKGQLSGKKIEGKELLDAEFGFNTAKQLGGIDIGQTVVVKDKTVVAVEAMEGTDECIKRAAALAGEGFVVVKVSKPNQDMRFDIPVIGINTIKTLAETKASIIVIEAGLTLMIDKDEVIALANEKGIKIYAL